MGKHKEWRKLAKKARRKRIRKKVAQQLHEDQEKARLLQEKSPSYQACLLEQKKAEEFEAEEEARQAAEEEKRWLEIEEEAKKNWQLLQEKLAQAKKENDRQAARIREEWDRQQKKLRELKEQKEREEQEKLERQQELSRQISNFIENDGELPNELNTNFETNPLKPVCHFFSKTGACRFKDICSRNHIRPGISRVLLISNFYSHYSLQQIESEYGSDFSLEYDSQETYKHFKEFFYDVFPELEKCGRIRQFKVCCNHEVHLRGNVYIEYKSLREAVKSFQVFHGRWYGGKQLNVEFRKIESWQSAICGLDARLRCPKGTTCNFLHVFRNPGNLFANVGYDTHFSPSHDYDYQSTESDPRNWRWSESPERIPSSKYNRINHKRSRKKHNSCKNHIHSEYKESVHHKKRRRSKSSERRKSKNNENHRRSSKSHKH